MESEFLYLSRRDIEVVNVPMPDIIECVETALVEKALKRTQMPAKHWLVSSPSRWFGAMSSLVPAANAAVVKWQSGSSENATRGLPYITGLLIMNDLSTGLPVALMDSTWITAHRTAAATAIATKYLANPDSHIVSIIGCGVQGRATVEALRIVRPRIKEVYAYDLNPRALNQYAADIQRTFGIGVRECGSAREAIEAGDIVVTAGPIEPNAVRQVDKAWLKSGALGVPLDYDCYWKPAGFADTDLIVADDVPQLEHLKESGYFIDSPQMAGELGDIVAGLMPGRKSPSNKIVSINMGIAVEDATSARLVYERARDAGQGTLLSL